MNKKTKEPKYKIGEKVWRIYGYDLEKVEIMGILKQNKESTNYIYCFNEESRKIYNHTISLLSFSLSIDKSDWVEEKYIFPTKQALIESL